MKSLNKQLAQYILHSQKQAFNFPLPENINNIKIENTESHSDYDYVTKYPIHLYEQNKEQMSHKILPNELADEISTLIPKNNLIQNSFIEGSGKLFFRLNNDILVEQIQNLANFKSNKNLFDFGDEKQKYAFFYPMGEINNQLQLNTLRGLNKMESFARMFELQGQEVQRFSLLDNYSPFHGIILAFLHTKFYNNSNNDGETREKPTSEQLQRLLTMENIAEFISEQNISTQEEMVDLGMKYLNNLDMQVLELYQQLTETAQYGLVETFMRFVCQGKNVEILKLKAENIKFQELVQDFGKQNKKLYHISNEEQNVVLEKEGYFTELGKVFGTIQNLAHYRGVQQFWFSSDFQDDNLFMQFQRFQFAKKIQISYIGHANLFYENQDEIKLNTYEQLFDHLGKLQLLKMKEKYTNLLPGDLEDKYDAILAQCLGWTRFLDHKKEAKIPYILKCENICNYILDNEELTNLRLELNEILQSYTANINSYKISKQEGMDIQKMNESLALQFTIQTENERILCRILTNLPDQVYSSIRDQKITNIIEYFTILTETFGEMKSNNYFAPFNTDLSRQEIINRITLLRASINALSNVYYILGVFNEQQSV